MVNTDTLYILIDPADFHVLINYSKTILMSLALALSTEFF
jgi:hypothetical protein